MPKRITATEFDKFFREQYKDYVLLTPYSGYAKKVTIKHKDCEYTFSVAASYLWKKHYQCKVCKGTNIVKDKLKNRYGNKYTLKGFFENQDEYVPIVCHKCGYIWDINIHSLVRLLNGNDKRLNDQNHIELCPQCRKNSHLFKKICLSKNGLTNDEFLSKVKSMTQNEFSFLDPYQGAYVKLRVKHNKCGFVFKVCPHDFYKGSGCPKCNSSKGERFIRSYLVNNHIKFEQEKEFKGLKDILPLRFDFYLPDYNTVIEYDGIQHYIPQEWMGGEQKFEKQKYHDGLKNTYCNKHRIKLVRISYRYNTFDKVAERLDKML